MVCNDSSSRSYLILDRFFIDLALEESGAHFKLAPLVMILGTQHFGFWKLSMDSYPTLCSVIWVILTQLITSGKLLTLQVMELMICLFLQTIIAELSLTKSQPSLI